MIDDNRLLYPKIILYDSRKKWCYSAGADGEAKVYVRGYSFLDGRIFFDEQFSNVISKECSKGNDQLSVEELKQFIPILNGGCSRGRLTAIIVGREYERLASNRQGR